MLTQAILIGLVAMCVTFEWALGTCLASRPIVTGVLIGLVMGDLQTGIIVGATLEMVFIGSVTIGAAVPPDVITGGILGTAFAISTGQGAEVALTLAFPIASQRATSKVWSGCICLVDSSSNRFLAFSCAPLLSISERRL